MARTFYAALALTGGASTALDYIASAALANNDMAYTTLSDTVYTHKYDSSSSAAESSPGVIKPDDNAGNGRWILQNHYTSSLDISNDTSPTLGGDLDLSTHGITVVDTAFIPIVYGISPVAGRGVFGGGCSVLS